jgi:hypothetical protein
LSGRSWTQGPGTVQLGGVAPTETDVNAQPPQASSEPLPFPFLFGFGSGPAAGAAKKAWHLLPSSHRHLYGHLNSFPLLAASLTAVNGGVIGRTLDREAFQAS